MSRFLGPIHHWLFNKIKYYETLEKDIINEIKKEHDIDNILEDVELKFQSPLKDEPLEEIIDTDNIHGWLQSRIKIAETRQAYLISKILEKYTDEALNIIEKCYSEQGSECGKNAKDNYDISTAETLFKALNNYILDGMPCDNANNITLNESNILQWKVVNCLHKSYWDQAYGDINVFYKLRAVWITSFIKEANPNYEYIFSTEIINSVNVLVHEIKTK